MDMVNNYSVRRVSGSALRQIGVVAREFDAISVGVYELGYSFRRPTWTARYEPDWTRQAYLVAGWSADVSLGGISELLVNTLNIWDNPILRGMIEDSPQPAVVRPESLGRIVSPLLRELGAEAAAAMPISETPRSMAILFFRSEQNAIAAVTRFRDGRDAVARAQVTAIRTLMNEDAEREWFDILAQFHRDLSSVEADAPEEAFDEATLSAIIHLGHRIACPDIRVYLPRYSYPLPGDVSPLAEWVGSTGPLFRLRWTILDHPDSVVVASPTTPLQWVLSQRQKLAMHNYRQLPPNWFAGQTLYRGLKMADPFAINEDGSPVMSGSPIDLDVLPSLLIHPIRVGGNTIGAILCNGRRSPIFVFRERDDEGIGLIAEMLGNHWVNRQRHVIARRNREIQSRASEALADFSNWVSGALREGNVPDDDSCMDRALTAADHITGVTPYSGVTPFSSARVPTDRSAKRFVFGPVHGPLWTDDADIRFLKENASFDVTLRPQDEATSIAEYVLNAKGPAIVDSRRPPPWYKDIFRKYYLQAISVPVYRGGDRRDWAGIIDVRTREGPPFPPSAAPVLMQLSEQLGLTLALLDRHRDLIAARESQLAAFQDLRHQIITPHRVALRRIEQVLGRMGQLPQQQRGGIEGNLAVARGQTRRALRVGAAAGHFADLHQSGRIIHRPAQIRTMSPSWLAETIHRIIGDQRALSDPAKRLTFTFVRADFADRAPSGYRLTGEPGLIEQLLGILLENADKYSFRGTEIRVDWGDHRQNAFVIDLTNFGYTINKEDLPRLRRRGERGTEAPVRVANGQGIGLWLADAIALSFGGRLEIEPGSRNEPHHFQLLFPVGGGTNAAP